MKYLNIFLFTFIVSLISFELVSADSDTDDHSTFQERADNRHDNRVGRRHNRVARRHHIWSDFKDWVKAGHERRVSRRFNRRLNRQDRRKRRQDRRHGRQERRQERRDAIFSDSD